MVTLGTDDDLLAFSAAGVMPDYYVVATWYDVGGSFSSC